MMNHLKILEVLPPCEEIVTTLLPLFILQCPPFATSLDPNCFSSHLFLLPCCPLLLVHLPRIFLLLAEQSMYKIITPLQSSWNYLSNEWSFIPIGLWTRELRPLVQAIPDWFQNVWRPKFGSPKMLILDTLESRLNGALEYPIFPICTSLNMCLILMKTTVLLSGFWRCWSWFQLLLRTPGSDSPCLQNDYNAQSTPEVTVTNTHPMLTNHDIPKIFTCGIVNLVKILMGVPECERACKW
jgi:hypothetical protein